MTVNTQPIRSPGRLARSEWIAGYLFASPFIIGFLIFFAYPMVYSLYLAFHK